MQTMGNAKTMTPQCKQQRHDKEDNFTMQTTGDDADHNNRDNNADNNADINTDNNATMLRIDEDADDNAQEMKTKIRLSSNIKLGCACNNASVRCKNPTSTRLPKRRQILATHIPM